MPHPRLFSAPSGCTRAAHKHPPRGRGKRRGADGSRKPAKSSFKTQPCLYTRNHRAFGPEFECGTGSANLPSSSFLRTHRNDLPPLPFVPLFVRLSFALAAGQKKPLGKHNKKCFLPFRLWILHLAHEADDSPLYSFDTHNQSFPPFRFLLYRSVVFLKGLQCS